MITMNPSRHSDRVSAIRILDLGATIERVAGARLGLVDHPLPNRSEDAFGRIIWHAHASITFNIEYMYDDILTCSKLSYLTEARLMAAACVRGVSYSTRSIRGDMNDVTIACLWGRTESERRSDRI